MALDVGSRLGHYDVTALIGEGGMGQVYQATDTKLNRQVALKILPEAFATDPDRLARFQREAQVLASLNHPGIAAIYGIEEAEDTRALVLELVEGPTLADRISKGAIPLDEALPIAKQIAEALEAAHEAGVIHRDLKPANIKVREDGTVKVLDFGLAKALDTTAQGDPSQSPTLTAAATQMGVIMGTAAYMSPEQASGKPVDKRADVWAFGAVLYEMLTGRRPFTSDDVSKTLAHVIATAPDWGQLPGGLPPVLAAFLQGCLEKDPRERVRDIGDVRLAMKGAFETTVSAPSVPVAALSLQLWQRPIPAAIVALAIAAIAGLAVWTLKPLPPQPVSRFAASAPPSAPVSLSNGHNDVAISRDGTRVVYRAAGGVFHVRSFDQLEGLLLRGAESPNEPFLSPDGAWVGFVAEDENSMQKVSILGGPPVTICELPADLRGASWGQDDVIIFGTASDGGLMRVSGAGGEPETITTPQEGRHVRPDILPGGAGVLFTIDRGPGLGNEDVALLNMDTGEHHVIIPGGTDARYLPTGHIVYGVDGTLRAVAFDLSSLEITSDPVPVVEDVLVKSSGAANFSISDDGHLVFVPFTGGDGANVTSRLVVTGRDGAGTALAEIDGSASYPRFSPDGTRVVFAVQDADGADLWVLDIERGTRTRLTSEGVNRFFPVWSPDGSRLAYADGAGNTNRLLLTSADGSGEPETLLGHHLVRTRLRQAHCPVPHCTSGP